MDMFWYLRNQRSKQGSLADLQFLFSYALFSQNWCRKLLKKNVEYESILYNSTELSVDWTSKGSPNQTILFILFSKKIKSSI